MKSISAFKKDFSGVVWSEHPLLLEVFWQFEIPETVEKVWPFIADTSRFNRALGLTIRQQTEKNGQLVVRDSVLGMPQEWIEEPWVWNMGKTIFIHRTYRRGIAYSVQTAISLEAVDGKQSTCVNVYFAWVPRGLMTRALLSVGMKKIKKKYGKVMKEISDSIKKNRDLLKITNSCDPQVLKRVHEIGKQLVEFGVKPQTVDHLSDFICYGDEMDLYRLRVRELSNEWGIDERELLNTCLHATRLGLLTLSWDVICPHCRGVRDEVEELKQLKNTASCEVCQLSFDVGGEDSIEITFHIHPAIREVKPALYCAAEPARKKHIIAQQVVRPQEMVEFQPTLSEGRYRLRWVGQSKDVTLEVRRQNEEKFFEFTDNMKPSSFNMSTQPLIRLKNQTSKSQICVLEESWWYNTALKPSAVFSLQEFRDIFSKEHLDTNVKLSLGRQVIIFTDIVGSTKFYRDEGDAKAFLKVKEHFGEIKNAINQNRGTVVKTIGDAVMGAFAAVDDAFKAAIEIQKAFGPDKTNTPIRVRVSMHVGSVIAVNLNSGIDYFGNSVNFASKLQAFAGAYEIAVSEEIHRYLTRNPHTGSALLKMTKKDWKIDASTTMGVYIFDVSEMTKDLRSSA